MEEVINELINEIERKILNVLTGAYNTGDINDIEKFQKYQLEDIKSYLFMINELDSKLMELDEGDE